jgi:hypothetical protein
MNRYTGPEATVRLSDPISGSLESLRLLLAYAFHIQMTAYLDFCELGLLVESCGQAKWFQWAVKYLKRESRNRTQVRAVHTCCLVTVDSRAVSIAIENGNFNF